MTEGIAKLAPSSGILRGRAHDVLLVALIALRPLIWSGEAGAWDNLAWLTLVLVALGWLTVDAWRGRLPAWRCAGGGVLATALLLILLPAALRSPHPSTGLGLWGMAVIHLGFAAYLMQVISGRERLAFAALSGALAVECLLALGQWAWVLPGMARALAGGGPTIAALENAHGDLAERVANGGLFGTFTLANTLAAFLLLAAVPSLGSALAGRGWQRIAASALVVTALIVALGTASKGAVVALLLAGGLVWTIHIHGRGRWLAPVALILLGLVVAFVPAVQRLGAASAQVRLGYWQGAATLIAEAPLLGHGLDGFAAHGARAMPLTAEPTRHVHNDVLEAAVDGGVPAGLALLALLGWCARSRPLAANAPPDRQRTWQATWPLLLLLPLFAALGMLASNLEWWPLGAGDATWWLWPMILAAVLIGVALACARLPLPPAWAWQLALAAFAIHCLVDFDLQSPAIWGTLIVVAVLAGGRAHAFGVCTISRGVVTLLVLLGLAGCLVGMRRAVQLELAANQLSRALQQGRAAAADAGQRSAECLRVLDLASQWPADQPLSVLALRGLPRAERIRADAALLQRYPWDPLLYELQAQDLGPTDGFAAEALRTAITLDPAYLPRRQRLVELYEQAAAQSPQGRTELLALAAAERQRIAELAPVVHPRNRLVKPLSALPVQPAP